MLESLHVFNREFNSYGSRRGNDAVMARGTFANIRIVNKFVFVPSSHGSKVITNRIGSRHQQTMNTQRWYRS